MTAKSEFLDAYKNIQRAGSEKLLDYLENHSDFFTAPASTRFHLSREGGLCEHSVHVYQRLRGLYSDEIARGRDLTPEEEETVAICGLLHDMCKTDVYKTELKNRKTYEPDKVAAAEPWQVKGDAGGQYIWESVPGYVFCDDVPYGHGEKSVYMISGFMSLSREEAFAIRYHMGFSDADSQQAKNNVGKSFELFPLATLLHIADLEATYLDERESKGA